jgi:two-component system, LuxR family, response regulator FixJ
MRDLEPTVFIVDNDTPTLKSLEALMQSVRLRVEIYLLAEDFLRNYDSSRPGCLILGVRLPRVSGLEVHKQLRREGNHIPVIFLTQHGDVATAVTAMREGAFDFLQKPCNDQYLVDRVQAAIAQNRENGQRNAEQRAIAARLQALSPRERDVVNHLMGGRTSKSIARELGVSLKTVDFHRANIMRKTGVQTVAALVHLVIRGGYSTESQSSRPQTSSLAAI